MIQGALQLETPARNVALNALDEDVGVFTHRHACAGDIHVIDADLPSNDGAQRLSTICEIPTFNQQVVKAHLDWLGLLGELTHANHPFVCATAAIHAALSMGPACQLLPAEAALSWESSRSG